MTYPSCITESLYSLTNIFHFSLLPAPGICKFDYFRFLKKKSGIIPSLFYFAQHNVLCVHSYYHKWQDFLLFKGCIIFLLCVCKTQFLYPFIHSVYLDAYLGHFHIRATVNNSETNIVVHISL